MGQYQSRMNYYNNYTHKPTHAHTHRNIYTYKINKHISTQGVPYSMNPSWIMKILCLNDPCLNH